MSDDIDLVELRASIRDVLDAEANGERVRRHFNSGALYDEALSATVASLGWPGLHIAEADGGLGLGFGALAVLYEELGRGPAPLPMLPTLLVAEALSQAPGEVRAAWLPRIAAGELFAAYAPAAALSGDPLTGTAEHVLDGGAATLFLVGVGDRRYALVARGAPGLMIQTTPAVDRTRSLATLIFDQTPILPINIDPAMLERHAALGIACDSIGGAEAILDKTVEYLKIRTQFGQPIGQFQALKHRVADHKLRLEAARALLSHVLAQDGDGARALGMAALARATATGAYAAIADDAVQLHGGIGFTWEHECHIYLKRAWLNRLIFGSEDAYLDRAAMLLSEAA